MFTRNLTYIFVIIISCGYSFAAEYMDKKADWIKTCQRKSPDDVFVPCSTKSLQVVFEKLASGIDGLNTTIDTIHVKRIDVFSTGGLISLDASLSDATVKGFGDLTIERSYFDPDDFSWIANVHVPKLRIDGHYEVSGRIIVLPLSGSGKCWLEPHDLDILVTTKFRINEKFGHAFFDVSEANVNFNMTGLKLQLDDIFYGIKFLEDRTNAFLNEHWKALSDTFKPLIKKTIEDIFTEVMNSVFNFIPAEYLISDTPHSSDFHKPSNK